jgi:transglutaminase-like putative cysteine protease
MVQIELDISLEYEVEDPLGADFIFNIHAATTAHQTVQAERLAVTGDVPRDIATDAATASRFMRLHADPGTLVVRYEAEVTMNHYMADPDTLAEVPVRRLPLEVMPYLYPSRYCQSDRLLKLAWGEFGTLWPGYSRVLAIQHWVQKRVTFASNSSGSSTSAIDTIVEPVGVCRDFAHLMIAMCRAMNIPARIVTGTDYGANPSLGPPDFHAYVEAYLGDRWYLFDPSGTGIPMGFVRLGTGRDAADVAFATIFGKVSSKAPWVQVTASKTPGSVLPHHCREALSTTAPSAPQDSGGAAFDANADARQPVRQLPN